MQKCTPTKGKPWPLSPHDTQILCLHQYFIAAHTTPSPAMHPIEPIPHFSFLLFLLHMLSISNYFIRNAK